MKKVFQFTMTGVRPESPSISFAYEGLEVEKLNVPTFWRPDVLASNKRKARRHARKVRKEFPKAFEQYTAAAEEAYAAEERLNEAKAKLQAAPSAVDAYAMEIEGTGGEAEEVLASKAELEKEVDRLTADFQVKRDYFHRLCYSEKALKALNDALKEEAGRRAKKAADGVEDVLQAIQALSDTMAAFDNYRTENLTGAIASVNPINPSGRFARLESALKKEAEGIQHLKEAYERLCL